MHKKRLIILFYLIITSAFLLYADNDSMSYKMKRGERPFIDISKVPDEAFIKGVVNIKFKSALSKHLDATPVTIGSDKIVQFGLPAVDAINKRYKTKRSSLIFSKKNNRKEFSKKHRAWGFDRWYKLEIESSADVKTIISELKKLPEIEAAEPEYKKRMLWLPNDEFFNQQWHYNNTGQSTGIEDCDIDLPEAWEITKGNSNVIVAVIDGGIQYDHPDLAANMWSGIGYNFVTDNTTINPEGHGTHVAGTIAANTNNDEGVAGVAGGTGSGDGVRLMSCQVFDGEGQGGFDLAFVYAADNGAAIAQNSWGYTEVDVYDPAVLDAIDYFNANGGGSVLEGGITFFSASNDNSSGQWYPGCYSGVVSVAATDNKDQRASYSNYDTWVDISAPGGDIVDASNEGIASTYSESGYIWMQGTSMACPHVSGAAALVISLAPTGFFSADDVNTILLSTTDDHYAQNPSYIGMLGTGRLNAYNALVEAQDYISGVPRPQSFSATPVSTSQIDLSWVKNINNDNVIVAWNTIATIGNPTDGISYTPGEVLPGGGTVLYKGANTLYNHTSLSAATTYYYRAWSVDASNNYSVGRDASAMTLCDVVTTYPFTEGFEGGELPACWSQETGPPTWQFVTGGEYGNPSEAHSGSKNALLADQSSASNRNKLITPALDLTGLTDVQLIFWHAQDKWQGDQDELRIYYKTSEAGSWTLLQPYTSEVSSWIDRTISLPNTSAEYYVAFEGDAQYGFGVCIDDITIDGDLPTYEVTVNSSGGGTTSPSGTQTVSQGSDLLISASPDEGYSFSNWTSTGGLIIEDQASASTKVLNVTSDGTVTANFVVNIIKGPYLQKVTDNSIVIMWETGADAESRVDYGVAGPNELFKDDASPVTIHEMQLTSLAPDTKYYYTVTSDGTTSPTYTFSTAPTTERNFRFVAYGDTRTNPSDHTAVVQGIINSAPEFVLNSGDLVNNGRDESEWGPQFFDPAHDLMFNTPMLPILGNHEYWGSGQMWFFDFFSLPGNEEWFAFSYSNARFIGLNTNVSYSEGSDQYIWLEAELQSPEYQNATWHIVYFHHPPYTATTSHIDDEGVIAELVPLFEQYDVDMVFNGHSHVYERYHRNMISYIVTGGGGAPLGTLIADTEEPIREYGESVLHHCVIDVNVPGQSLTLSARYNNGVQFDGITLIKHTVTFVAGSNGSITGNTVQTVKDGSNCTEVEAVPDADYHFDSWTGDYIGAENPLTLTNVTSDMTITANFVHSGSISVSGISGSADVFIHATNGWQGTKALDGGGTIPGLKPGTQIISIHEPGKRTELVPVTVIESEEYQLPVSLRDAIPVIFTDKTAVEDNNNNAINPGTFNSSVMDDIDRDGDVDLVVAEGNGDINYYLYNGGFVFNRTDQLSLQTGEEVVCIRCIDIDADGVPELIVALNTGEMFTLTIADASRTPFYGAGNGLTGFDFIEANGDGDPDLLLGYTNGTVYRALSNGSGSWYGAVNVTSGGPSLDVGDDAAPLAMDLDGDGIQDLVVGNQVGDVQWFKGNGTLEYEGRGSVNSGGHPLLTSGNTALSVGYNATTGELPFIIVTDAGGNVYQSQALLLGDLDNDGQVFIGDFSIFVNTWQLIEGDSNWNWDTNFDVTPNGSGDQEVNISDHSLFNDSWRKEK